MKKVVRLTEQDLHRIVRQSVQEAVDEGILGRITGGIKGGVQAVQALHKMGKEGITPRYKNTSKWHKFKKTMANQAADSDRNQEFNNLINKLYKLQLNGYFDARKDIYSDVDNLINKLKQFMTAEEYQTQGQYKNNFGQTHPDKVARDNYVEPSRGAGTSRIDRYNGYNGSGV